MTLSSTTSTWKPRSAALSLRDEDTPKALVEGWATRPLLLTFPSAVQIRSPSLVPEDAGGASVAVTAFILILVHWIRAGRALNPSATRLSPSPYSRVGPSSRILSNSFPSHLRSPFASRLDPYAFRRELGLGNDSLSSPALLPPINASRSA